MLTDLMKASALKTVRWNEECDRDFKDFKRTHKSVCSPQPWLFTTCVSSDRCLMARFWSSLTLGDGWRHTLVSLSRKLLDQETRYSTAEKEFLSMKFVMWYYLLGRHFTHETDHWALQWLMKDSNTCLAGWYLSPQPYDFAVQYHPGKANLVWPDSLQNIWGLTKCKWVCMYIRG